MTTPNPSSTPMAITYNLTWDPSDQQGKEGSFGNCTWTDRTGTHSDRRPDGTSWPGIANVGDNVAFVVSPSTGQSFPSNTALTIALTFARTRGKGSSKATTPFSANNLPYSLLLQVGATLTNGNIVIPNQGISLSGFFEFSVALQVGNSPIGSPPGRNYTRDPELDVGEG
jgi:hypothetical protein